MNMWGYENWDWAERIVSVYDHLWEMRMWDDSGRKLNYVVLLMNELCFHMIYMIVVLYGCDYELKSNIINKIVVNVILHNWYVWRMLLKVS